MTELFLQEQVYLLAALTGVGAVTLFLQLKVTKGKEKRRILLFFFFKLEQNFEGKILKAFLV